MILGRPTAFWRVVKYQPDTAAEGVQLQMTDPRRVCPRDACRSYRDTLELVNWKGCSIISQNVVQYHQLGCSIISHNVLMKWF